MSVLIPPVEGERMTDGVDTGAKASCKDISWGTTEIRKEMISMAICDAPKRQEMVAESEWHQPVVV